MAEKYSHDEAKQKVIDLLCDISGEDDVADNMDTDLFEEGYLDSMGAIELLVALEDELDMQFDDDAVQSIATIGQAVDAIAAEL